MTKQGETIISDDESTQTKKITFFETLQKQIKKLQNHQTKMKQQIQEAYGDNNLKFKKKPDLLVKYDVLKNELKIKQDQFNQIKQYNKTINPIIQKPLSELDVILKTNNLKNRNYHYYTQDLIEQKCNTQWSYLGYLKDLEILLESFDPLKQEIGFCSSYYNKIPLSIHPLSLEYCKTDQLLKLITKQKILIGSFVEENEINGCWESNQSIAPQFSYLLFISYKNEHYSKEKTSNEPKKKWTNYYLNESTNKFIWSGSKNNDLIKLYIRNY